MMKSVIAVASALADAANTTDTCSDWACLEAADCTGTPPAMYVCSPDAQCVNNICDGSGPAPSPIPSPGEPDGPDEYMAVTISYMPSEGLMSASGINHYRLTMDGNTLYLIAVDKDENPIDPSDPTPHEFDCQNSGLFDELHDKRDCLKLDQTGSELVSNPDDTVQNPCVLDFEQCHVEHLSSKKWQFLDSFGEMWCMGEVDTGDGKTKYPASAFRPLFKPSLSQCSDKWNVKKIWKGRKGQAELHNSAVATCSDCTQGGANFQCLTSKGCSSAADESVCTGLKGGGTWCATPSTGQCFHDSVTNACGPCSMEYECGNYDTEHVVKCFKYPDPQCPRDMLV
jgi:hypothetical protein